MSEETKLTWEDGIRKAIEVANFAAHVYDIGAGSAHSEEARKVGKDQALWIAAELKDLLE